MKLSLIRRRVPKVKKHIISILIFFKKKYFQSKRFQRSICIHSLIWNGRLLKSAASLKILWLANKPFAPIRGMFQRGKTLFLTNILPCVKSVQIRSFFWSAFSGIRTEYGEIQSIPPYSVRMRENTDRKNSVFGYFSGRVLICSKSTMETLSVVNPV